uniref:Uncharacterized protein n=1 Tax=Colletotrichum scovillei TaxID=1209932 RepID=A0A9P7UGB6_9PEZI
MRLHPQHPTLSTICYYCQFTKALLKHSIKRHPNLPHTDRLLV